MFPQLRRASLPTALILFSNRVATASRCTWRLQAAARNEDKENDQADADQNGEEEDHQCSLVEELADVWFAYAGPDHEGILAEAHESEDRVDIILL